MYKDKIAVITGGTGALGKTISEKFAELEMKVYVPVKSIEKFRDIFDNSGSANKNIDFKLRKIYCLLCDAVNEKNVHDFISDVIKREGRIDYLINTIGGYHSKKNIVDMESNLLDEMLEINFKSTFYFCKYALKSMIEKNFGRITVIGAMPALEISPGKLAYSVSKSNVINLIQTIAEETKEYDITANAIIPSIIDTPANRQSMPKEDFKKWVKPEDIADTILFLLSDAAKSFRGNAIKMFGSV